MSFLSRLRGNPDKSKNAKKSWEPPKIPPVAPDNEYEVERKEASDKTSADSQTAHDVKAEALNEMETRPVSKFGFILNETEESTSRTRSASNRSLQKSLFSFISEPNEIDDDNRQVFSNEERNFETKKHKESIGSCESGSAFGFISDDHVDLDECTHEVEANSADVVREGGYLPFEDTDAQKETNTIAHANGRPIVKEDEKAEIGDVKVSRDTVKECEGCEGAKEQSDNDDLRVEENDGNGNSVIGPNRMDLGIRNETLDDLGSIICKNLEDSTYDVHLDDEEKFEVYLETLKSRESSLRRELNNLRQSRDDVLSNLKETTFSKEYLCSELMDLQREQNMAVSKEDFALADKINQQVELKQSELRNLKYQHPLLDKRVLQFVNHCNTVLKNHLDECAELQTEFQGRISTEKESIEKKIAKTGDEISKARLKFDKEKSKLDREMSHIRLDKEHLEKSRIQLENEVCERTHDQQLERSMLKEEKQFIRDEIDELEAKLLELRGRESTVASKIEDVDLKIQEMTVDFRPLEESMDKESRDIAEKEAEVAEKLKILEEDNTKLIERKEAEEHSERKCMENIDALASKIASLEGLRKEMNLNLVTFQEVLDVKLLNFLPSKEHELLSESIKDLSNRLSDAKCQDVDCSTQITRIKKRLDDIEARVEELEKEKQMAVSGRNFKAAKIITEERNKILEEGQEKQEALKGLEEIRIELNSSIDEMTREISSAKEESSRIELEADKMMSSTLTEALRSLQDYHNNSTFDSWIRPFIGFEIEICQDIITEMHSKHGWKEPHLFARDDDAIVDEETTEKKIRNPDTQKEEDDIIKELESQLQMAIESEDFDTADEINCKIEEYRSTIGSLS